MVNDPYLTGSHLNDMMVMMPLFYGEKLVGFSVTKAHWDDIGAMEAGQTNHATEIYQEGYRLVPTKVIDRGEPVEAIMDFLIHNSRVPKQNYGDLWAMVAACRIGEKRFDAIIEKYGIDVVEEACEAIFKQCEMLDRQEVAKMKDGEYFAEGCLDGDGVTNVPVHVKVKVTVKGDEMAIDLTGSDPQTNGCINCGFPATISVCRMAFKFMVNSKMPITGGNFKNLHVIAEEGSIFYAKEPAACQYYYPHLGLMIDMILQAIAEAAPDKVIATQCADPMNVIFTGRDESGYQMISGESTAIGWGAHLGHDGENGMINYGGGDLKNYPVEVMENNYPIAVEEYSLKVDSCGAGEYQGGLGVIKCYEMLKPMYLNVWFDRSMTPGLGILGGKNGEIPKVFIDGEPYPLKIHYFRTKAGAKIKVETGGGGGYGDPIKRDPKSIRENLADGYITENYAVTNYQYHPEF